MSRFITAICAVTGLAALAAGIVVAVHPVPLASVATARLDRASLQRLNDAACRCQGAAGPTDKTGCWAAFDQAMQQRYDATTAMAAACFPVHTGRFCWESATEDSCKEFSEYFHMEGGKTALCPAPAAKVAEQLWNKTPPRGWPAGTVTGRAACSS